MIASLDDAWRWYEASRFLTRIVARLGSKHWNDLPWDGEIGRDPRLRELTSAQLLDNAQTVLDDLDDLCVLLLFSVFEAAIRQRVLSEVDAELPVMRHVAIQRAIEELKEGIEQGSFFRVLEPYKELDPHLIERAGQSGPTISQLGRPRPAGGAACSRRSQDGL